MEFIKKKVEICGIRIVINVTNTYKELLKSSNINIYSTSLKSISTKKKICCVYKTRKSNINILGKYETCIKNICWN